LTKGTNEISDGILTFELGSFKFKSYPSPCEQLMILPGDYKIHLITENDSLIFSKGVEENKIKYYLKRISH
jgi:hypothetical protein